MSFINSGFFINHFKLEEKSVGIYICKTVYDLTGFWIFF